MNFVDKLGRRTLFSLARRYNYRVTEKTALIDMDSYLDKSEFQYILWIDRLYEKIRTVPGWIVELGVYRGRNAILFGNLIRLHGEENLRRYYGFDTFQGYTQTDIEKSPHLSLADWKGTSLEFVQKRAQQAKMGETCQFIAGDIKETVPQFVKNKPNVKIALLYIDCNAYAPAISALETLKPFMSPNAVICVDEKQLGSETQALYEFTRKYNLPFVKDASPFSVPAYTVIPDHE